MFQSTSLSTHFDWCTATHVKERGDLLYPSIESPPTKDKKMYKNFFFFYSLFLFLQRMTVEDLLNVIEEIKTKILIHKKNQKESIDVILSKLEELIELSTHVYLDLNYTDIEQRDHCAVNFNDIRRANDITNSLLLKIVSSDIIFDDDHDDERIERASRILAHMSGRGGKNIYFKELYINCIY